MINLDLTQNDAVFLQDQLAKRARQMENELVHTDKRSMQADLARDLEQLERLQRHVGRLLAPPVAGG